MGRSVLLGLCAFVRQLNVSTTHKRLNRITRSLILRPQIERESPAELKHINKRRKRNQLGFPQ